MDVIETYMTYKNKNFEIIKKEIESKPDDLRKIDIEGMEKLLHKELSQLKVHQMLS